MNTELLTNLRVVRGMFEQATVPIGALKETTTITKGGLFSRDVTTKHPPASHEIQQAYTTAYVDTLSGVRVLERAASGGTPAMIARQVDSALTNARSALDHFQTKAALTHDRVTYSQGSNYLSQAITLLRTAELGVVADDAVRQRVEITSRAIDSVLADPALRALQAADHVQADALVDGSVARVYESVVGGPRPLALNS